MSDLEAIFLQAIEIPDPQERRQFALQASANRLDMQRRLLALITAHERENGVLDRAPVAIVTETAESTNAHGMYPFFAPPEVVGDLGKLGQYRIVQLIGRGGMGVVFRAIDSKLQRVVAIKVLSPELASDSTSRLRFEREARAAAAISHPHVVVIYAVDDTASYPFLAMEFVQGKTLADKLKAQGRLPLCEVLRIGWQMADGLAAAHRQGVVHRDIKPSNILLENGIERVKISDFGLAQVTSHAPISRPGDRSGTPQYMSPEQIQGTAIDFRTDQFSLGCVLYTMCVGVPPFQSDNLMALMRQVCEESPQRITEIDSTLPEWLAAIIDKLLAKRPVERFASTDEVAEILCQRLAQIQAGMSPSKECPTDAIGIAQQSIVTPCPQVTTISCAEKMGFLRSRIWLFIGITFLGLIAYLLPILPMFNNKNVGRDTPGPVQPVKSHVAHINTNLGDNNAKFDSGARRRFVEWAIARGGEVYLGGGGPPVTSLEKIPDGEPIHLFVFEMDSNEQRPLHDDELDNFQDFPGVANGLILRRQRLTSAGIARLGHLLQGKLLNGLQLVDMPVGLAGFKEPGGFAQAVGLTLQNIAADDHDLVYLKQFPQLRGLNLRYNKITNRGLVILAEIKTLEHIHLEHNPITDEGISCLQAALPNCEITTSLQPAHP